MAIVERRTEVVGISPNEAATTRLVGAILLGQNEAWAAQRARNPTLEWVVERRNASEHKSARQDQDQGALPDCI